jgi:signal transduction histidine kinase
VSSRCSFIKKMDKREPLHKRIQELEIELDETKSVSSARSRLLEMYIQELDGVHDVLRDKLKDLRERERRIEEFQQELIRANKLSDLGELAGSVAHEMKNPLIALQGFAKRIEKVKDRGKVVEYARLIDREAERLTTVVTKLLEFSRMEEPRRQQVDINGVVEDTVLFMEYHLTRFRHVTLEVEKLKDIPPVYVEKIHLQQVLVNLMINAAQAMPQGGMIKVRTERGDGHAVVLVSDQGEGIKQENLQKIFEPFFTTKEAGKGTGLGLSLSKRLIEANDGTIEVESQEGKGTTFRLRIPLAQ